jgi:HD-like signal output (HDOD) protein
MNNKEAHVTTLIQKIQSFPALPAVVGKVIELSSSPDSSVDEFLDVIKMDVSLTTSILKLANSAFYGQTRKVSSLQQAIPILGLNEIRNMVIARALFNSFKTVKGEDWFDIKGFWVHSFLCGLAAKVLAREKEPDDDMFICGLIHDIGKLVILMVFPVQFAHIFSQSGEPMFDMYLWEEKYFGVSHGEIGLNLLRRWFFPDKLVDATGFHHHPERMENNRKAAALIYFADMLAHLDDKGEDFVENPEYSGILFRPLNEQRASIAEIPWQKDALRRYLDDLKKLKQDSSDLFSLFFT